LGLLFVVAAAPCKTLQFAYFFRIGPRLEYMRKIELRSNNKP
jgi:hypothetical protein